MLHSDDIVDEWARSQNWMQKEGDFVIALIPDRRAPTGTFDRILPARTRIG